MIDLSHLTEEEQDVIMTVLQRDAQLKKAEEERVRKLEKIVNNDSHPDNSLKYFTGEWFYEAKSRRHMDKIHGSEIILASMKRRKSALDGSLRLERSKSPSSQGSDTAPPPKPARTWDALQPQEINHAEQESPKMAVRSPRTLRHNPFNRASLLVMLDADNTEDKPSSTEQPSSGTEPLKSQLRTESSQTSAESVTSGSSAGFRPVPKKRTFLSRRPGTCPDLETQTRPAAVVPAPRRSLQRGSSGSSNQSCMKPQDEMSSCQVSVHPSADAASLKQVVDTSQVLSHSSLDREGTERQRSRESSYITREREAADRQDNHTQRQPASAETVTLRNSSSAHNSEPENFSSVGSVIRQDQLSLTQSIVATDPPISYDLNFIDKSDQQVQAKAKQMHAFKLCTQTTSPTGDEDDSIAKVLEWFSRSTDSSDWLNTEDEKVINNTVEVKSEDPPVKQAELISDRLKATLDTKRKPYVSEAKEIGNREQSHKEVKKETWENTRPQEAKDNNDEPPNISHLKSFWEKSNTGPKILISKSNTPSDRAPKTNKDEEKSQSATDMQSAERIPNGIGTYKHAINHKEDKDQLPQKDINSIDSPLVHIPAVGPELLSLPGLEMQPEKQVQSRVGTESLGSSFSTDRMRQTVGVPQSNETKLPEEMGKRISESQLQAKDIVESDKLVFSRNTNLKQSGQISPKTLLHRSSEDINRRNSEDRSSKPGMTPKRREDMSNKDKSPVLHRQGVMQEAPVKDKERIKHLKSFWEQERTRTGLYTGKPKTSAEVKVTGGTKLNKRFAKSEFDLQLLRRDSGSEEENTVRHHQHFTGVQSNQKGDKLSPSVGRRQFNSLRDFWDEATSDSKVSFTSDKSRSPKWKEQTSQELKCGEPEISRVCSPVEKTSSRPAMMKSSPPPYNRSKSPLDKQTMSRTGLESKANLSNNYTTPEVGSQREVRRSSKDSGKDPRSPKSRKDSFGNSSSRINSFRRATSMFSLSTTDETDQLKMVVSPVHSHSRKQRLNIEKGAGPRRHSEDTETLTPRARAFVPRDYRHYLGMTDKSVHTSLAPAVQDKGSEGKSDYEYDFSGPVRASTPLNSEELCSRRGSKTSQRPLCANHSSSDTGQESPQSSASECWSKSRLSPTSENDNDSAVRRALRRAEARPKNLAKSMEDVTATSAPQRRQELTADQRCCSDGSPLPSPSSSLFSDPEHMKKMSKSVPSFLQKELSGSVMTMYSADFGSVDVQGSIQFSIHYVQKLREFHIFVAQCQDLAPVDPKRGRSDPYVKSYLVPDKANLGKRKTSVKKKTLNPTFNEILRYRVRMEYLRTQTLVLSVWHHDTFGKNSFLGEIDVDLSKWDFDHTQMNYLALKARTCPTLTPSNSRGEMRLAIRFLPQIHHSDAKAAPNTGEIHIWVKECKNLPLIRAAIDPYVKCFVLPDTSKKSRQKTRVLRSTVDPVFNHTMVYDGIREADLTEACVELTVLDRDRLASNLLGGLRLGAGTGRSYGALVDWMDSTPYEVALWERMMASPNEWVEDVLPLRWLHSAKTTFK